MKRLLPLLLILLICMTGCASKGQVMDGDGMINSYSQISQEEAKTMMEKDDGHIIVDVRRQDEYDSGHIPGAILIPNESIGTERPEELPDLNQIILIYCRSGNRSKQAAQKLFDMGYTNIYEFGGINTWDGEIATDEPVSKETEEQTMKIGVSDGTNTIIYNLNDSPSAKSLYSMLPIDIAVENYGSNEKIFYPEQKLDTEGGIEGDCKAGTLALFSPWGNVVMYYGPFSSYPGLYLLGEAVEGVDQVKNISGTIHVEAVE